ncbi:MAG: LuxR C-terminal-related transcriptional regulator, partial [Amnibacterium sp.]
ELAYTLDVLSSLPHVQAPTLVLHRSGDRAVPVSQSRVLAERIPGSVRVELPVRSHLPAFGDASAVVEQVRRFLGLRAARPVTPIGLTARQTELASLVAEGLTNREIARRLHLSERSVESHLERIRLRLGFRSRAQVAAWYTVQERR